MNTRTHKNKIKRARKMMTPLEIKMHCPIFDSMEWMLHSTAKIEKVNKQRNGQD